MKKVPIETNMLTLTRNWFYYRHDEVPVAVEVLTLRMHLGALNYVFQARRQESLGTRTGFKAQPSHDSLTSPQGPLHLYPSAAAPGLRPVHCTNAVGAATSPGARDSQRS